MANHFFDFSITYNLVLVNVVDFRNADKDHPKVNSFIELSNSWGRNEIDAKKTRPPAYYYTYKIDLKFIFLNLKAHLSHFSSCNFEWTSPRAPSIDKAFNELWTSAGFQQKTRSNTSIQSWSWSAPAISKPFTNEPKQTFCLHSWWRPRSNWSICIVN